MKENNNNLIIGLTANNEQVLYRTNSHFHPEGGLSFGLLREAIHNIEVEDDFASFEIDMGKNVGFSNCVATDSNDEIVMVFRKKRIGLTPMVKNRTPEPCRYISIVLARAEDAPNCYNLITAYIGKFAPREPWDPKIKSQKELMESKEFWMTHALIFDESAVDYNRTLI